MTLLTSLPKDIFFIIFEYLLLDFNRNYKSACRGKKIPLIYNGLLLSCKVINLYLKMFNAAVTESSKNMNYLFTRSAALCKFAFTEDKTFSQRINTRIKKYKEWEHKKMNKVLSLLKKYTNYINFSYLIYTAGRSYPYLVPFYQNRRYILVKFDKKTQIDDAFTFSIKFNCNSYFIAKFYTNYSYKGILLLYFKNSEGLWLHLKIMLLKKNNNNLFARSYVMKTKINGIEIEEFKYNLKDEDIYKIKGLKDEKINHLPYLSEKEKNLLCKNIFYNFMRTSILNEDYIAAELQIKNIMDYMNKKIYQSNFYNVLICFIRPDQ